MMKELQTQNLEGHRMTQAMDKVQLWSVVAEQFFSTGTLALLSENNWKRYIVLSCSQGGEEDRHKT